MAAQQQLGPESRAGRTSSTVSYPLSPRLPVLLLALPMSPGPEVGCISPQHPAYGNERQSCRDLGSQDQTLNLC